MSRRKPIDAKILEASKEFDAHVFAETVKGVFSDFPDYRRNQKCVLYPIAFEGFEPYDRKLSSTVP
jgi:hypothetical protein